MGCGIYKITNRINKKVYVGSSLDFESRKYKHLWMLENNRHDNEYLQKSYNKYGSKNFTIKLLEECEEEFLIERENHFIELYNSNEQEYGYNLAKVNEFRRNKYNDQVKKKLSLYNLKKNNNFSEFILINIKTNKEYKFNNLVDASNYLISNGFANGKPRNVRMKLSASLRGKKLNNGTKNETIRKTCYKHYFKLIK